MRGIEAPNEALYGAHEHDGNATCDWRALTDDILPKVEDVLQRVKSMADDESDKEFWVCVSTTAHWAAQRGRHYMPIQKAQAAPVAFSLFSYIFARARAHTHTHTPMRARMWQPRGEAMARLLCGETRGCAAAAAAAVAAAAAAAVVVRAAACHVVR